MVKLFLVFLIHPLSVCQRLVIINLREIIVPLPLGFQAQLVAVVLYIRLLLQSLVHLKGKKMFAGLLVGWLPPEHLELGTPRVSSLCATPCHLHAARSCK